MSVCELYNETVKDLLNKGERVSTVSYGENQLSEVVFSNVSHCRYQFTPLKKAWI